VQAQIPKVAVAPTKHESQSLLLGPWQVRHVSWHFWM